jgi:photosystem II stability/assembly factor-like uncharacterized protein
VKLVQAKRPASRVILVSVLFVWVVAVTACSSRDDAVVVIALHPKKPNILYIATNEYIYKSRDTGKTWENISGGMSHSRVISMAIDPASPAIVYAGTKGDAVYKSYDGGQRWVPQKTGLDDVTITSVVNDLVFDPTNSSRLFAATTLGVFESVDGGDSWKKRMEGMKEILMVVSLTIDQSRPNVMYAGTTGGVYVSKDQARTWAKANQGLISPDLLSSSRALMVNALAIDPTWPDTVYAGTLNGLYRTRDGARSWERIAQALPDQMIIATAVAPGATGTPYVAGRRGLYKSSDGGATWKAMNNGLESLNIRSLAISQSEPDTMYLGTNGTGLYRSRDGGERWESVPVSVTRGGRN